ncbi:hypothetical protein JCM11251_006033 [Rhodosporidiobolus azoricus]
MQLHGPGLSLRAEAQLESGAQNPLLGALMKTFSNQYDKEKNPKGVVNVGLAENVCSPSPPLQLFYVASFPCLASKLMLSRPQSLLHDWLIAFFERQGTLKLLHTDLTYGQSILGSNRIFSALSSTYARFFNPVTPVKAEHICTSNGVSSMIEHLAACTADEGDCWLIPAPYYNGFTMDLNATSKVGIASVQIPEGQHGELGEVEVLEKELQRRAMDETLPKVTAVLVTNPHNPLGFCYTADVLLEYCRFAERHNLWLIVDEIYALSVFDSHDLDSPRPFTSILSVDVFKEAGCNPARVVQLYGMSKDFGANGLRAGNLVCQHNPKLVGALASTAMPMRMGSPTDALWSALLNSPELPTYLSMNRRALSGAYAYLSAWLRAHNIPYRPANAGHFILADFRTLVSPSEGKGGQRQLSKEQEIAFLNRLVDEALVYFGPGFSYEVEPYGFFRLTFCIRRPDLEVALSRVEKMCNLSSKALELSKQYPV